MTNARNRIAVLDVDSTDERIFADALNRYGDTPVKVQTGSGKFHGLYRFSGERRRIRPFGEVPIDILGTGGFVIAPPSVTEKGTYRFIEGGLDDLDRLPIMRGLTTDVYDRPPRFDTPAVTEGKRNDDLWRQCMREAKRVDSFDALLNVARTLNKACSPPLDEREIVKIAQSAWNYEERGLNKFGQHGAWLPANEYDELLPFVHRWSIERGHQERRALSLSAGDRQRIAGSSGCSRGGDVFDPSPDPRRGRSRRHSAESRFRCTSVKHP